MLAASVLHMSLVNCHLLSNPIQGLKLVLTHSTMRVLSPAITHLGRFPFVRTGRSDWSVRKWNARVLRTVRTGSGQTGPTYGVGLLSSPGPARNAEIAREFYALKMAAGSSQTCGEYNRFLPKFCALF